MTTETAADVAEVSTAMTPLLYRIQRVHKETYDTFTIELVPKDGAGISPFGPGQFNMLYVFGVGEVPISISGDPGDPGVLVHTTRAVGTAIPSAFAAPSAYPGPSRSRQATTS
jgi:NAD(P)H-flavin reductase